MPQRRLAVVLIVIATFAGTVWLYGIMLFCIAVTTKDPALQTKALEFFKDFGIYAAGVLSGVLVSTRSSDKAEEPLPVKADQPLPVKEVSGDSATQP